MVAVGFLCLAVGTEIPSLDLLCRLGFHCAGTVATFWRFEVPVGISEPVLEPWHFSSVFWKIAGCCFGTNVCLLAFPIPKVYWGNYGCIGCWAFFFAYKYEMLWHKMLLKKMM
ncbi:hypothetical protein MA16_Dca005587 [Dendrobium catenatum]|uniref:Uncharacterized protein n=1 Tax=Dendrobium catenatum TaxID=906689 RepID=A0A2I0WQ12_9ASPA|nr:hypothetical protein MA16_Dca005587 [Dendrobium catenatum]